MILAYGRRGGRLGARFLLWAAMVLTACAAPLSAHISEGRKLQSFLIWEGPRDTEVLVLLPAPVLFGDVIAVARASGAQLASPLLTADSAGSYMLRMLPETEPAFAARAARALEWAVRGEGAIEPELLASRLLPPGARLPKTPAEAHLLFSEPGPSSIDFGDGMVALHLRLPAQGRDLAVRGGFPPLRLPPATRIETRIIDLRGPGAQVRTHPDQLDRPLAMPVWLPAGSQRPPALWLLGVTSGGLALSLAALSWLLRRRPVLEEGSMTA